MMARIVDRILELDIVEQGTAEHIAENAWKINSQTLHRTLKNSGTWCEQALPMLEKQTQFFSAQLCRDISCTVSCCHFKQPYQSHIHYEKPTTLLVFGVEGISQFSFPNHTVSCIVRPGDVWLLNIDDQVLSRATPANTTSRMAVIKYATERINQAFHQSDMHSMVLHGNQMIRVGHQQSPDDWIDRLVKNPMLSISDRLFAEAKALELIARWISPTHDTANDVTLQPVIDLLIHNLAAPPSLDSLAKAVDMSHARLNRQFKHHYGMTVFDWLRRHRLERARGYLMNPNQAITSIAFNCGFSSASHFTQAFKAYFGATPSQFRQQNQ